MSDIKQQEFLDNYAVAMYEYGCMMCEPFTVYRPRLFIDGDQWCALYGDNIQDGVAGFGASPQKAVEDFNRNWNNELPQEERNRLNMNNRFVVIVQIS